jgi:hypothetical protein
VGVGKVKGLRIDRMSFLSAVAVVTLFCLLGCDERACTTIVKETSVFPDYGGSAESPGEFVPVGASIASLAPGEEVEVFWKSDLKDQRFFRVRTKNGTEGYIFHEPGIGEFAVSRPCAETVDR